MLENIPLPIYTYFALSYLNNFYCKYHPGPSIIKGFVTLAWVIRLAQQSPLFKLKLLPDYPGLTSSNVAIDFSKNLLHIYFHNYNQLKNWSDNMNGRNLGWTYTANIFTAKTRGFHCGTNPTAVSLHFLQKIHCKYFFAVFTFNICIVCL